MRKLTAFFARLIAVLERFSDRPWYFPVAGFAAALDLFVVFIPMEGLLVSSVILQPAKWVRAFLWVGMGSGIGSLALGFVSHAFGPSAIEFFFKGALSSPSWASTQHFLDSHGALALALIAFSPIPLQPAVVLSGLAGMPMWGIFASVWVARTLKFGIYAWVATHAPGLLRKLKLGFSQIKEIEAEKETQK